MAKGRRGGLNLHEQAPISVWTNLRGDVVIRQQAEVFEDNPFVLVRPENIVAVARAMLIEAGHDDLAELITPGRAKAPAG